MAKVRVHELAKELNIPSKDLVTIIQNLGIDVKNHMSSLEQQQAEWVKKKLQEKEEKKAVAEGKKSVKETEAQDAPATASPAAKEAKEVRPAPQPDRDTKQAAGKQELKAEQAKQALQQHGPQRTEPHKTTQSRPAPQHAGQQKQVPQRPAPGGQKSNAGAQAPFTPQQKAPHNQPPDARRFNAPAGDRTQQMPAQHPKQQPRFDAVVPGKTFIPPSSQERKKGGYSSIDKEERMFREEIIKPRSRPGKKKGHNRGETRIETTPEFITIGDKITVRELAEKLCKSPADVIKRLLMLGVTATLNQDIEFEIAELIASEYDVRVEKEKSEEELIIEEIIDDEASLKPRPPVVTVMGHVDHGKTSLLDAIRETNVVAKEAGGITQHIGAYQVEINGEKITFIDTPGHEAFTAMRARGAQVTDLAVLVVAADDGVMPQTVEAINHARAANVPILVAINKIDKENANPDRVKQQLTEYNLIPEEWGGDTIYANVSAKSRQGIEHLLEMILLLAEMCELKANPDRPAEGVVIEGQLDKGRGPVATVLVQKGTLKVGDAILCGTTYGKVRAMMNHLGERVSEAGPSTPVEVLGLDDVPMAGDKFRVVDEKIARQISQMRLNERKREEQARTTKVTLDDFFKQMKEGSIKELNLIIKGDVQGSVEALIQALQRLSTDEVKVNVIHSGVGAVNESDVMLAAASNAIIIGFNVRPDAKARKYAEEEKIDVRLYRVIYEVVDDIRKAMAGLLEPDKVEEFQGRAEVRATFKVPKVGTVAGCYVTEGKITRNANARVLRDGVIIWEGKLASLKRFKDDVREVQENFECGIGLEDFNDVKEGDIIETYTIKEVPREL